MNDFRLYFYAMEQEFLFIPDVTRQHFIFILEAFRKVGRRRESHFIRYFRPCWFSPAESYFSAGAICAAGLQQKAL